MDERGISATPLMGHLRYLSVSIGRRPAASRQEERAARYLEETFREMGLDCRLERFHSRRGDQPSRIICFAALFFSVLFYRITPLIFYGAFLFFLVLYLFEMMGRSFLGSIQWRHRSGNLSVRIDPLDKAVKTIVVMAPLDNPFPSLFKKRPGANSSRFPLLLLAALNVVLWMLLTMMTGAYLLSVSSEIQRAFWLIALAIASMDLAAAVTTIIALLVFSGKTKASENDSAHLLSLLQLGERFSRRRLARTRVWLVAVGSDSAGGVGVKRFVSANRRELKGAFFIFLDSLGRDRLVTYRKGGVFFPFRSHRPTLNLMESLNQRYPHYRLLVERTHPSRGGFHRLLSSGRHAVILSSIFDKERSRAEVQRDRVNPTFLRENTNFVARIIEEIDRMARLGDR